MRKITGPYSFWRFWYLMNTSAFSFLNRFLCKDLGRYPHREAQRVQEIPSFWEGFFFHSKATETKWSPAKCLLCVENIINLNFYNEVIKISTDFWQLHCLASMLKHNKINKGTQRLLENGRNHKEKLRRTERNNMLLWHAKHNFCKHFSAQN